MLAPSLFDFDLLTCFLCFFFCCFCYFFFGSCYCFYFSRCTGRGGGCFCLQGRFTGSDDTGFGTGSGRGFGVDGLLTLYFGRFSCSGCCGCSCVCCFSGFLSSGGFCIGTFFFRSGIFFRRCGSCLQFFIFFVWIVKKEVQI